MESLAQFYGAVETTIGTVFHFTFATDADAVAFKLRHADDLDFVD